MTHVFKRIFAGFALLVLLLVPAAPAYGQFNSIDETCDSVTGAETPSLCADNTEQAIESNSIYGPNGILTKGARIFSILVGIASVIMIIIGGFKYVLSGGDSTATKSAKDTIIYAVVGLTVALLTQAIIALVLTRVG
jgi:hypothetical protein